MLKITYAHLCEKAFLSQNGNLNLIGIFEKVTTQNFPMVFPQLSLVTNIQSEPGQHSMTIKVVSKKDGSEIAKPINLNMNVQANDQQPGPQNIRIIGDINNLNIKEAGEYEVHIFLNGEQQFSLPFSAQQAKKPIPEGR